MSKNSYIITIFIVILFGVFLTACDSKDNVLSNTEKSKLEKQQKSNESGIDELITDSFFGIKLGTPVDTVVQLKEKNREGLKYKDDVQVGENQFIYYWDEPVMSFEVTDNKVTKINLTFNENFKYIADVFSGKFKDQGNIGIDTIKAVYGIPQDQRKDLNSMIVYLYESKDKKYAARFIKGESSISMFLEKNQE